MSAMADLDIKLSEYKLSNAQKNAVLEVMEQGWTSAKANTIKSLENKDILVKVSETHHTFTDKFAGDVATYMAKNNISVEWQGAPSVADEVQAVQDVMFGGGENGDKADSVDDVKYVKDSDGILKRTDGLQADTFDDTMAPWEKELLGFGETLKWRNTKVWDGLTAEQIRKDLDTAGPVNRAARRRGQKISRQFLKALSKAAL